MILPLPFDSSSSHCWRSFKQIQKWDPRLLLFSPSFLYQVMEVKLKSEPLGYLHCWIASGSMLIYGYSLTMLSASNVNHIKDYYDIDSGTNAILSTINGFFAVGGLLGSALAPYLLSIPTKERYYGFMGVIVVVDILPVIPLTTTLYFSKFMLGFSCAFAIGLAGAFIRQSFSERLRRPFGAIYALSKMLGTELCYIVGLILKSARISEYHLVISSVGALLAIIQIILVYWFLPDIPLEMLILRKYDKFHDAIDLLYKKEDIPKKLKQIDEDEKKAIRVPSLEDKVVRYKFYSALHCGLLRQFCGTPYVIVYSTYIFTSLNAVNPDEATLFMNTVQVFAGIIGICLVSYIKRRGLVVFGTIFAAIFSFVIAFGDYIGSASLGLTAILIFMIPTAFCIESVTWFYPFDCTNPQRGKYASLLSWFGTACLLIAPPFIADNRAYPMFIFFGVYLTISIYINSKFLVNLDKSKTDLIKERLAQYEKRNIQLQTELSSQSD